MGKIGIIGGTGVYDPTILTNVAEQQVNTVYGDVPVKTGDYKGIQVVFVARHGYNHSVPPHRVNYRGNIMAMKQLGVERILAICAVGSLNLEMLPGEFVMIDQFIDFTKNRIQTFYDSGSQGVVHIDMTEPYCSDLRKSVLGAARAAGIPVKNKGTYVCTEGPRFETPAEIKMYSALGGDLVGMTGVPEVALAREAELCYVTIGMVTNFAAGISPNPLTHAEVMKSAERSKENLKMLIKAAVEAIPADRNCQCQYALKELGTLGLGK